MLERPVRTRVPLHARPLDRFVRLARGYEARVELAFGDKRADGKNVLQLLLLAVPADAEVVLRVDGPDEDAAQEALVRALESGEDPAPDEVTPGPQPPGAPPGAIGGVAGAPGVGVGRAQLEARWSGDAPTRTGPPEEERRRLDLALQTAAEITAALVDEDDPFSDIFRAQGTLLEDPELRDELRRAVQEGLGAEQAVTRTFDALERRFDALGDAFAAQRHADVADLRDRLLLALGQPADDAEPTPIELTVLVLHEATPSRMATLPLQRVAAVISERGGPTSHAAIVARGRGIPLVFATAELLANIAEGQWLEVDGLAGSITLLDEQQARKRPTPRATVPLQPTSGAHRVALRANLGAPGELALARNQGAEGCGLLRTELLFAGRGEPPSLEEQAQAYARLARALAPHPVVVRLFDAGSDKPLPFLPVDPEPNPALGVRGVRLLLRHSAVLADQLGAVARAREQGASGLHVMVPMVTEAAQLEAVRELASEDLPLGAMVETPAAALLAPSLAARASFLSIGSNDLAQYTLATDRGDAAGPLLHPAVLLLVSQTVEAARQAGIECAVCGELAGDPRTAPLLVGLGVHSLSMGPPRLALVRTALEGHTPDELRDLARRALELESSEALERLLG